MGEALSETEHTCEQCGEFFWSSARARFCSQPCRLRHWRARQPLRIGPADPTLLGLCAEVLKRGKSDGSDSAAKLLPRLFRAVAAELRKRGWDPIELLMTTPTEPATNRDTAPGGIAGAPPERRKWLYPPEVELEKLEALITARLAKSESVEWHLERREQLSEYLILRNASAPSPKAP